MPSTVAAAAHEATSHDLWERAAQVAGRLNRAHGELVEIAAQLVDGGHWGDGGFRSPEHLLVVRTGLSPAQAADVVRIARRRTDLPDTISALTAGELSLGQAAVVARHGRADHQAGIAQFARTATVPQLRRALAKSVFLDPDTGRPSATAPGTEDVPAPEDDRLTAEGDAELGRVSDAACARADLSMHYDEAGRFHLRYSAPAEIGALVEQAVKEAKDALFTASARADDGSPRGVDRGARPAQGLLDLRVLRGVQPPLPTYADAIAEIASRSLSSVGSTSRASHYRVYVHLDTGGAWVNGGGAITPRMASRFSCDGTVIPLWETQGRPISVGRDQRILPARTRRLIEDRDRGCRVPGCSATRFVEIHHLDHWADGGRTDFETQVSLCPFHHDAHHRGDITIAGDPTRSDGLTVTNRYGLPLAPPAPAELTRRQRPGARSADLDPPGAAPPDPAPSNSASSNSASTTGLPDPEPPGSLPYSSPSGGPMRACDVEFVPDAWRTVRRDPHAPSTWQTVPQDADADRGPDPDRSPLRLVPTDPSPERDGPTQSRTKRYAGSAASQG